MQSPKSKKRPWATKPMKPTFQKRKHLNKAFYNSRAWINTRKSFLQHYQNDVWIQVNKGIYNGLIILISKQSYILSLPYIPCKRCLSLYIVGAYDEIREGKEVDHIEPLNPAEAIDSEGFGDPFSFDNLQPLCPRHHAKKSNRDKRIINLKTNRD